MIPARKDGKAKSAEKLIFNSRNTNTCSCVMFCSLSGIATKATRRYCGAGHALRTKCMQRAK